MKKILKGGFSIKLATSLFVVALLVLGVWFLLQKDAGILSVDTLPKYKIVISEDATTLTELLADYFQRQIRIQTDITLEIVNDATEISDYEIVLGNTTREVSGKFYTDGKYNVDDYSYSIKNEGNSISVGYSDSLVLVDAFTELLDIIVNGNVTNIDIKDTYDMSEIAKAEDSYIRVMSHNIYNSLDSAFNGRIAYQARAELSAECYLRYKPDFIGMQEADQALRDEVYKYIAHEYAMVEFEMTENNWCPIFYRKDLYNLIKSDYCILDSMHALEWALYSDKSKPEQQFIHMNVHYNVDKETALMQAEIVNNMIRALMDEYPNVPITITGDYNATTTSSIFKTMMRDIDDKIQSGALLVNNDDSRIYTWHYLGDTTVWEYYAKDASIKGPIDHVSITSDLLETLNYKVIHDPFSCWASDHYPIFLDITAK